MSIEPCTLVHTQHRWSWCWYPVCSEVESVSLPTCPTCLRRLPGPLLAPNPSSSVFRVGTCVCEDYVSASPSTRVSARQSCLREIWTHSATLVVSQSGWVIPVSNVSLLDSRHSRLLPTAAGKQRLLSPSPSQIYGPWKSPVCAPCVSLHTCAPTGC